MVNVYVKKKNKSIQKYSAAKIKRAIMKSGGTKSQADAIVKTVEKELLLIPTSKIKSVVLRELKKKNKKAHRDWMAYKKKKRKR